MSNIRTKLKNSIDSNFVILEELNKLTMEKQRFLEKIYSDIDRYSKSNIEDDSLYFAGKRSEAEELVKFIYEMSTQKMMKNEDSTNN